MKKLKNELNKHREDILFSVSEHPDAKEHNSRIVSKYLDYWKECRNGKMYEQEKAINELIKNYPDNNNITSVLLKANAINSFYSTNIYDIYAVATIISEYPFDSEIQKENIDLLYDVNLKIKETTRAKRSAYSFLSKYCSFHKTDIYPIYDSRNREVLAYYMRHDATINLNDQDGYRKYYDLIKHYQKKYALEGYSLKEIDRFNWLYCNSLTDRLEKVKEKQEIEDQ